MVSTSKSTNRTLNRKRYGKWLFILPVVLLVCGIAIYGFIWIRRYQALVAEEPEIVLSPNIADIKYCTQNGVPQKMDLYFPPSEQAPWPVLVYAHGGSFTGGDKRTGSGTIDIPAMTARGFAVAAINYRLMPEYPFPAEIIDAKCAIRFLRAHADEYQLRVDKIGIWGGSAGGHLAAMVGLTNGDPAFDIGEYPDQSSRVDVVVSMFGPMDLTADLTFMQRMLLRRAFGTNDPTAPILHQASPINYVSKNAPPFLIMQGEQDDAVPAEQARVYYQKLQEAGVNAELVMVSNANHNFKPTGGPIKPTREEISRTMADFFAKWLK